MLRARYALPLQVSVLISDRFRSDLHKILKQWHLPVKIEEFLIKEGLPITLQRFDVNRRFCFDSKFFKVMSWEDKNYFQIGEEQYAIYEDFRDYTAFPIGISYVTENVYLLQILPHEAHIWFLNSDIHKFFESLVYYRSLHDKLYSLYHEYSLMIENREFRSQTPTEILLKKRIRFKEKCRAFYKVALDRFYALDPGLEIFEYDLRQGHELEHDATPYWHHVLLDIPFTSP